MARGVVSGMDVVIQVTAPTAEVCMSIHQPLNCRHSTGAIDGCAYSVDATILMRSFYDCAFHVISKLVQVKVFAKHAFGILLEDKPVDSAFDVTVKRAVNITQPLLARGIVKNRHDVGTAVALLLNRADLDRTFEKVCGPRKSIRNFHRGRCLQRVAKDAFGFGNVIHHFRFLSCRCIYRLHDGVYTAQAERANVRFGRVA